MSTIFEYEASRVVSDQGRMRITKRDSTWLRPDEERYGGRCQFCEAEMTSEVAEGGPSSSFFNHVFGCRVCGWWNAEQGAQVVLDDGTRYFNYRAIRGVLRSYQASDRWVPIDLLRAEIAKRPALAYESHPSVWEEIVGSVLSDVRGCEVRHVGRTGDGGIDLLLVAGDSPAAVQVKRREKPGSVEQVNLVREFLGATLLAGLKRAVLVTTADRYTRGAKKAATDAEDLKLADRFELVDLPGFVALMRAATPRQERWREYSGGPWFGIDEVQRIEIQEG